ncbi:MAG: wax ester/triacylglycerol synthase domain-containing protein [Solirubrobacteraceae bacterium]
MSIPDTDALREELKAWGRERELSELDTLMWRTERHPANSWTGVVIMLLDSEPEWKRFRRAFIDAFEVVPRFTERVIDPTVPVGRAAWAEDPAFDIDFHVRRDRLPAPGSRRQLLDLAQNLALTPLDRNRPPWVTILVEGLEGDQAAWILQVHHVLMDGAGATQLFERILGRRRKPTPVKRAPDPAELDSPGGLEVAGRELLRQAQDTPGLIVRTLSAVAKAAVDPLAAVRYATSLARVIAPPPDSSSPLLAPGTRTAWRFGTLECKLVDLKRAGNAVGGTVNDAYVCAVLGGLRRYHARFGVALDDVPMSMPVSVRRDDDPMGGNRFTGAYFSAPAGIDDPVERMKAMRERVAAVRSEPALDFINTVMPVLNRTPSAVATAAMTALNKSMVLTTSSWPGVTSELYVAGARFERFFVYGPLPGTRLTCAMNSHCGICCIGLNVDGGAFEDTELLWQCMQEGLDEILELGRT